MKAIKISAIAVVISILAIILSIVTINKNHDTKKNNQQASAVCSADNAPCIELADKTGKPLGVKFNDFRFGPPGCVFYLSLKSHKWVEYCGGYNLNWIGPEPVPGVEGKI